MFGNNRNRLTFHSRRNKEVTEVGECLLSCGAESLVLQFTIKRCKHCAEL
jgi:hypothetical protein